MPDSLSRLCDRARRFRATWLSRQATITIARADLPADLARFGGIALIDRRQVGWLVGGAAREFLVEPGEHTVSVYFSRRVSGLSIDPSGHAPLTITVSVAAGGRADFVCGARPYAVRSLRRIERLLRVRAMLGLAGMGIAAAIGWRLSPYLQQLVALAVLYVPDRGPLISLCYVLASPLYSAWCCGMLSWWAWWRFLFLPCRRAFVEIGAPYYLRPAEADPGVEARISGTDL